MIGNHLNKGNPRLAEANAFRLNVLPQLDQTKISGDKSSVNIMNLLVRLCEKQYPESIKLRNDLESIEQAAKISNKTLNIEITELDSSYQVTNTA